MTTIDVITDIANRQAKLCSLWFTSAAITVFFPLLLFIIARISHTDDDNDGDNNNNNNNNDDNNNNNNKNGTPWWFFGGGSNNNDHGGGGGEMEVPPVLIATYLWSLLVFGGLLLYGYNAITRPGSDGDLNGVIAALVLFANYSILSMFLFASVEGAIQTDGPDMDEHGFCGQFGVLMYITSIFWVIFSATFALIFRHTVKHANVTMVDMEPSEYKAFDSGTTNNNKHKNHHHKNMEMPHLTSTTV